VVTGNTKGQKTVELGLIARTKEAIDYNKVGISIKMSAVEYREE
jgi:hypothetical protein